jgi:hypothetical protein
MRRDMRTNGPTISHWAVVDGGGTLIRPRSYCSERRLSKSTRTAYKVTSVPSAPLSQVLFPCTWSPGLLSLLRCGNGR